MDILCRFTLHPSLREDWLGSQQRIIMDTIEVFRNINRIIQRESKTSTYKFALLRGTIEIIQENSPFIEFKDEKVIIPTGLLVEKWLYYYYPLFRHDPPVRQIISNENLAFGQLCKQVVTFYEGRGAISKLRNDLHTGAVPLEIQPAFSQLLKKIHETIVKMPMKHLGQSLRKQEYEVFKPERPRTKLDLRRGMASLIDHLGAFSIPRHYYDAFSVYGSFISGQDSILIQWAQFTEDFTRHQYKTAQVIEMLSTEPVTFRKTSIAQGLFSDLRDEGRLMCVWTGKLLQSFDVDHLLPFSIWKNNDLWNMLPCDSAINWNKRDSIPDAEALAAAKGRILTYWRAIDAQYPDQFRDEIQLALLGSVLDEGWEEKAYQRLTTNCQQLIEQRGHNPWKP